MRLLKGSYVLFTGLCLLAVILASLYSVLPSRVEPIAELSQEGVLDFAVILDKKSYKRDEPIQATFQLKNIGTTPILVKGRLALNISSAPEEDMDIYCEIVRNDKDLIRFTASVSVIQLHASHFVQLNSGDTIEVVHHDLRDVYRLNDPGKYSIRAIYVNTFDPENGQVAWKGKATSDIQTFVIEP